MTMIWQQTIQTPQGVGDILYNLKLRLLDAVPGLLLGMAVLFAFWLVAAIGARTVAYAAPRVKANTNVVLLLSRVYYYTVLTFGIITALSATGLNAGGLIAGLGLTGFALGFALKDVLSNLLSGIMLLLYRPFDIGDNITMGQYTGTIQTIRMRDTILLDDNGNMIVIPNSKLINEVVVNNKTVKNPAAIEQTATETEPQGQEALSLESPKESIHEAL